MVPVLLPFMGKRIAQGLSMDEGAPGLLFFSVSWLCQRWKAGLFPAVGAGESTEASRLCLSRMLHHTATHTQAKYTAAALRQAPAKGGRLPQLRAAVNRAGAKLTPSQRAAALEEAVEQFRRNNAVVAEFRLPLRSAAAAALRLAAAFWRQLVLAAVVVIAVLVELRRRRQQR
jgi:hypothetical protein